MPSDRENGDRYAVAHHQSCAKLVPGSIYAMSRMSAGSPTLYCLQSEGVLAPCAQYACAAVFLPLLLWLFWGLWCAMDLSYNSAESGD